MTQCSETVCQFIRAVHNCKVGAEFVVYCVMKYITKEVKNISQLTDVSSSLPFMLHPHYLLSAVPVFDNHNYCPHTHTKMKACKSLSGGWLPVTVSHAKSKDLHRNSGLFLKNCILNMPITYSGCYNHLFSDWLLNSAFSSYIIAM